MRWYAVAHPGLEAVVAEELTEAGFSPGLFAGGVGFEASLEAGARLARTLRTPDRLLAEVARGRAPTSDMLAALVRKGSWKPLVHPLAVVDVQVTTRASKLHFRDSAEKRVAHAIQEAIKGPRLPDVGDRPRVAQRVQVRIDEDVATVSVDAGGELLHKRGWRADGGGAPLRENLAASLLRLAGWDGTTPFLDPFCGSGTLPIEAARMASGRPPHTRRAFACDEWPALARTRRPAEPRPTPTPPVHGADRDPQAVARATRNARAAGVDVYWHPVDIADLLPPAPTGTLVTNPPWGLRMAPDAVASVYGRFGRAIRERFEGWRVVFLAPHASLAERVHRDARPLTSFTSGGVRVGVWSVG